MLRLAYQVALEQLSLMDSDKSVELHAMVSAAVVIGVKSPEKLESVMALVDLQIRRVRKARERQWTEASLDSHPQYCLVLHRIHNRIDLDSCTLLIESTREQLLRLTGASV